MNQKEEIVKEESGLKISYDDISLDINGTFLLNLIDADDETNYHWTSGNTAIVCVLGEGKTCNVMGVGQGESYIKVRDDIGNEGFCNVVVSDYSEIGVVSSSSSNINNYVEDVKSLSLSVESINLKPQDTYQIKAAVAPSSALKTNSIYYTSTDSSIVEVFEGGNVLARSIGYATIQVSCGNKTQTCDVCVEDYAEETVSNVVGISSSISLSGRDKKEYSYRVEPETLAYTKVTFSIEDESIAIVSHFSMGSKIVVSSLHPGATILKLKCGNYEAQYFINVEEIQVNSFSHTIEYEKLYFMGNNDRKINLMVMITISFKVSPANSSALYAYVIYNGDSDKEKDWLEVIDCPIAEDGSIPSRELTINYEGSKWSSSKDCGDDVRFRLCGSYSIPSNDSERSNKISSIKKSAESSAPYLTTYSFFNSK